MTIRHVGSQTFNSAYDPLGNMLTASRGGAEMSLTYDKAGRKLTMDDPDMGDWSYVYNALGGMTSQTDARGCTLTIGYDVLNRPTSKASSGAGCGTQVNTSYTYDVGTNGKGRRTSMNDASGSSSWLYDSRGRVTKETKVISGTSFITEWTLYNSADLPVTMKYPDGEEVTTTYDNNMSPKTTIGNSSYVSNTNYDSAGRMTSRNLGNGLTQTYTYYPWNQQGGRLQTLATGSLQNMTYVYDSVGNITSIADSVNSIDQSFGYDALDRLTSASATGAPGQGAYSETYDYDPATGNLRIKGDLTLEYLDTNHVHAVTNANSNTYSYDSNGNQITRTIGPDTFTLIYDAENRLVEVKKNNVTISQFTYDGDGKRVKSVIDGETIRFVGGYYERKGSEITKYYMAGATRVAMRKYTIPQNMTVEYMLGDHLGSASITTDANGVKVSEIRYKPWGETRYTWTNAPANTSPAYELVKYQYTGQYSYDVEFGLKYYGARFYDSAVGRFVSADTVIPSGLQGYDRYAYANNSPLIYTDPSGHFPLLPLLLIAGALLLTACAPTQPALTPRQEVIQTLIQNQNYQGAIDKAVELYDIDTSGVQPSYNSDLTDLANTVPSGGEFVNGVYTGGTVDVVVGPNAFKSPDMLVSTLVHESVHVEQFNSDRYYESDVGGALNELEAYDRVDSLADSLELSNDVRDYMDNVSPAYWWYLFFNAPQELFDNDYLLDEVTAE